MCTVCQVYAWNWNYRENIFLKNAWPYPQHSRNTTPCNCKSENCCRRLEYSSGSPRGRRRHAPQGTVVVRVVRAMRSCPGPALQPSVTMAKSWFSFDFAHKKKFSALFSSTYTKIRIIQRRLAQGYMQIHEVFHLLVSRWSPEDFYGNEIVRMIP